MSIWPGPIPGSLRAVLSGQSSGSFSARGQKTGWQISGNSRFKGIFAHDRLSLEVPSGQVQVDWNGKGLLAADIFEAQSGRDPGREKYLPPIPFNLIFPGKGNWKPGGKH